MMNCFMGASQVRRKPDDLLALLLLLPVMLLFGLDVDDDVRFDFFVDFFAEDIILLLSVLLDSFTRGPDIGTGWSKLESVWSVGVGIG